MLSTNASETGRLDWIEVPDTAVRKAALLVTLIAIGLIATGFIGLATLLTPADTENITRLAGL
jgi:hypothetical protein